MCQFCGCESDQDQYGRENYLLNLNKKAEVIKPNCGPFFIQCSKCNSRDIRISDYYNCMYDESVTRIKCNKCGTKTEL